MLTKNIDFYRDFQEVVSILMQIRSYITADTDTTWAGFDNAEEFLLELDKDIISLTYCDFSVLNKVYAEFLLTCTYQEIAISNGWSSHYLKHASDFDKLFERLSERKPVSNLLQHTSTIRII